VIIINTLAYGGGILTYTALTALFLLASLVLFMLGGGGKNSDLLPALKCEGSL